MKITMLKKQRYNDDRYNIFIDNEFGFSASLQDVAKYSIKEGIDLTEEELLELIELCEESKAYNYALSALSIRDYTAKELEKKLKDKEYSLNTVTGVLEKLKLYGIINDERYVEKYINDSQKIKKVGVKKVLYNLERKGIAKSQLADISVDRDLEYENACTLALKKLKLLSGKDKQKEKVYRYLISKGYDFEVVKRVINRIFMEDISE